MSHEVFALATIRPTTASNHPNSLSEFGLFDNLNKRLSDNISKPPLTLGSAPVRRSPQSQRDVYGFGWTSSRYSRAWHPQNVFEEVYIIHHRYPMNFIWAAVEPLGG